MFVSIHRAQTYVHVNVCTYIVGPSREGIQYAFESVRGPYGGRGQKDTLVCTMDAGGGTFHCATMLCGNNAQTNDSVVAGVITSGTHWAFPLLASLFPPSVALSFSCSLTCTLTCYLRFSGSRAIALSPSLSLSCLATSSAVPL